MSPTPCLLRPCVLWFTGFSGAGKTTIATTLQALLQQQSCDTFLLDGDQVRTGLCSDLGFSEEDRYENIRRIGEVAKLFCEAGKLVIVTTISPFRKMREDVRARMGEDKFVEVFINTPLSLCEQRDPKGLYRKARSGQITHFTGIDSPYEPPLAPEISLPTDAQPATASAQQIINFLIGQGYLRSGIVTCTAESPLQNNRQ